MLKFSAYLTEGQVPTEHPLLHVMSQHGFKQSRKDADVFHPREGTNHVKALEGIHQHLRAHGYEHSYDDIPHMASNGEGWHSHDFDRGKDRISVVMKKDRITHVENSNGFHGK